MSISSRKEPKVLTKNFPSLLAAMQRISSVCTLVSFDFLWPPLITWTLRRLGRDPYHTKLIWLKVRGAVTCLHFTILLSLEAVNKKKAFPHLATVRAVTGSVCPLSSLTFRVSESKLVNCKK
jgi:hypothetical protein